jgi:tetratricopeptide (TPR) repeat protein
VVDFETRLRRLCTREHGNGILGEEYFLDHVHPTIDLNRRLALWIIEDLQAQRIVGGRSVTDPALEQKIAEVQTQVLSQLDLEAEAFALRNLAKVLHWAGKYAEALPRARDTLELVPGDPESRYIVASCLNNLGRVEQALQEYELLFSDGVGFPRAYQSYGELLAANNQLEKAKAYLLLAVLRNPQNAGAYESLAAVHLQLNEPEFAEEALQEANRLDPRNVSRRAHAQGPQNTERLKAIEAREPSSGS